jgi:hypothetical protein
MGSQSDCMRILILAFIPFLLAGSLHGRGIALKYSERLVEGAKTAGENDDIDILAYGPSLLTGAGPLAAEFSDYYHAIAGLDIARRKKQVPSFYDVRRETGAYSFDTVYQLKIRGSKLINIGVQAGYTYFDRYTTDIVRSNSVRNSPGLVGGLSLITAFHSNGVVGSDGKHRQKTSFLGFNADAVSFPYRQQVAMHGNDFASLDVLTQGLSARIYMDARFTSRSRRGAFSTRYLIGMSTGAALIPGAIPVFVGLGLGYRIL